VLHGQLVHGCRLQLHPADPARPPLGGDLEPAWLGAGEQPAPHLAELGVAPAVVSLGEPELAEEVLDLLLLLVAVERLREDLVGVRVAFEDDPTVVSVELQRLGAVKEILDVEGRDLHRRPGAPASVVQTAVSG
jgi:hypothetical protein